MRRYHLCSSGEGKSDDQGHGLGHRWQREFKELGLGGSFLLSDISAALRDN